MEKHQILDRRDRRAFLKGHQVGSGWMRGLLWSAWIGVAGCSVDTTFPGANGDPVEDGNRGTVPSNVSGKTRGEPNDTFTEALTAVFDDQGLAALQGTISETGDVDVYELGAVAPGDRLVIDAETPGSALDVTITLFDDAGRLVYFNDDASDQTLDAQIDFIARHAGSPYYLLVGASSFADPAGVRGVYSVDITYSTGHAVPSPVSQILFLDFRGGAVNSPTLGSVSIAPFDAGAISPRYEGQTDDMKELIRETMIQNFERFDVQVLTSDDPSVGEGVEVSTVFFGGFDSDIFGEAENIDWYNVDYCDDAIVYTESFDPRQVFRRPPSTESMARAIGNVASHEAGHILGLNHVDDDLDLMDTSSLADALAKDQEFMIAPLSPQIAPIGIQDAVLLLLETLGAVQES